MPKRKDIKKILIIGSGPIVIGSGAEFDYSGTQALLSLKKEGFETILINPNPATIMTDKKIATNVYMEPLNVKFVTFVIAKEKPDAILPSMGGQVALNLVIELEKHGVLDKYNVKVLGTSIKSIKAAEDRQIFKSTMKSLNIPTPPSIVVKNKEDAIAYVKKIGMPVVIRPSYTMGGSGGGIAKNEKDLHEILTRGLRMSPINEVLVEKSIEGYKEIEYEVMRDSNGTSIVVCNMENIDPVGVHTGDSMVIAPSLTLTNKQYQMLRDVSLKIINHYKIEGGCNVQLALEPNSDKFYVIEINPRVSRSSALASKATGYPIAEISAKIAIGLRLDEIINPITKKTFAAFEPSIDYIVTKLPRFPFDKFRATDSFLGTYMQATGETMAIGRNFEESFLKSLRSLTGENKSIDSISYDEVSTKKLLKSIGKPNAYRLWEIFELLKRNISIDLIHEHTKINKFFLSKFRNIINLNNKLNQNPKDINILRKVKEKGFSDLHISKAWNMDEKHLYDLRHKHNIKPTFKMIDTVAGEFEAKTNYLYSTYNGFDNESRQFKQKKVIIIGSGAISIGQGVEFDYATVHSIWAFKEQGYKTIVINNNPETVSTDFSIADKLYFEPINVEDVREIIDYEKPEGVILQFGGQTALNLARDLTKHNIKIIGSSIDAIDVSENRQRFSQLLQNHNILQPQSHTSSDLKKIPILAKKIGYPIMIRPSYVIGGKGMQILTNESDLLSYLKLNVLDYKDNMILLDRYLPGKEIEVDAVFDGKDIFIPGVMEHVEKSGIHSGDSTTVFPTFSIKHEQKQEIEKITKQLAKILNVRGLMNVQFILYENQIYVLEVNLRSSRTVPFISKAANTNLVQIAVKVLCGISLQEQKLVGLKDISIKQKYFVKFPVFSFHKLHRVVDLALGPEMKSTGEAIGIDLNMDKALYKAMLSANFDCFKHDKVLITVNNDDKPLALEIAKILSTVDIKIYATYNTHKYFMMHGFKSILVGSSKQRHKDILNLLETTKFSYIINTPGNLVAAVSDAKNIRTLALFKGVPTLTSIRLAKQVALLTSKIKFLIEPAY